MRVRDLRARATQLGFEPTGSGSNALGFPSLPTPALGAGAWHLGSPELWEGRGCPSTPFLLLLGPSSG